VRSPGALLALVLLTLSFADTAAAATVVQALGDARIARDAAAGAWTISADAVQDPDGADRMIVKPVDLRPDATYRVVSVDTGLVGEATGADLMASGIELLSSPNTAAHVLTLVLRP
jgi:hypothetical protein